MKNTITSISICFIILFSTSLNAQEFNKKTVKKVNQASELFCSCINDFMGGLHPALTNLTVEMMTLGEDKAQENFQSKLLSMKDSELEKMMLDADKMVKFSETDITKKCGL